MFAPALALLLLHASPDLDEGRVAFSGLKYARAVDALGKVVTDPNSTVADRLEAFELLARAQLALGHGDKAQAAWLELLTLNPAASDPQGAPSVRTSFLQAKRARFPPGFVQLKAESSSREVLEVTVVNPWSLALTIELWESVNGADFQKRTLGLTGQRLVSALKAGSRNYVRVLGHDGTLLASLASASEPVLGPTAPVSDVPRAEVKPQLSPTPEPKPETPVRPHEGFNRRPLSLVLTGIGAAALIGGAILLGIGLNNDALARAWPQNDLTLGQRDAAALAAPGQMVGGGIIAGVGVVAAIAGLVLFLTAPSPVTDAP